MFLKKLRDEIDKIDVDMQKQFLKRMAVLNNIAELKATSGEKIVDPERENEIITSHIVDIPDEFKEEYIIFIKNILHISKEYQERRIKEINSNKEV